MARTATANAKLAGNALFTSVSTTRLKSLYSDLSRQKTSNPAAYSSNVDWWKRTLSTLVEQGLQPGHSDALILHASPDLIEALRYEGVGKPLGLAAVITELRDAHSLIPLEDFTNSPTSISNRRPLAYSVVSYALGKPLWWALEQLSLVDSERIESEASLWKKTTGEYIVLRNVEKAADAVIGLLRQNVTSSPADSLYSLDSIRRLFGQSGVALAGVALSEADIKVLLKFLERDRRIIVTAADAVKFVDVSNSAKTITAVDKGILELKTSVEKMELQVEAINTRITEKLQKISESLRASRKEVAMTHLKSRKLYEELLRKRLGSLEVLQSTLIQVETAAQDVEIMKQYESSTATLRAILSHPSLQREKIDATLDAMAEASAEQREIDEFIRAGTQVETEDETELQAELAGLVAEVQSEQKGQEELRALEDRKAVAATLPSVPTDTLIGVDDTSSRLDARTPISEKEMSTVLSASSTSG